MLYDRLETRLQGRGQQLRMSAGDCRPRIVLSADPPAAALSLISQPDLYGDGNVSPPSPPARR